MPAYTKTFSVSTIHKPHAWKVWVGDGLIGVPVDSAHGSRSPATVTVLLGPSCFILMPHVLAQGTSRKAMNVLTATIRTA